MLASERRALIADMVKSQSAVTTAELMGKFNVSFETVRKDLMVLEKNGELERVHGGAVKRATAGRWYKLPERIEANKKEKMELSRLAMRLIIERDTIAVDAGSTAFEFADELKKNFSSLTIVTHSLGVFNKLIGHRNFNVILCGGYYLSEENSFYGAFTIKMLDDIHVNKVFVFPSAISIKKGISDYNPILCEIQKKLITIGDKVIILADSSKYEKTALIKVCSLSEKFIYISDSSLPSKIKEIYMNNNIKIITESEEIV
jgi:DeoR/GlpR family transcriptional regulator of sugar metabolism